MTTTLPDGIETFTIKGVPIEAPLTPVDAEGKPTGPLREGSNIARFAIQNLDPATPWDSSYLPKILDERITITKLSAERDRILVTAAIDMDAPPSAALFVHPPGSGGTLSFPLPAGVAEQSLQIEQREPDDIQLGQDRRDKLLDANDSNLYRVPAPGDDQLVYMTLTRNVSGSALPALALLPASGKWRDRLPTVGVPASVQDQVRSVFLAPAGRPLYPVIHDPQGQTIDYTLSTVVADLYLPASPSPSADPAAPNQQFVPTKGATCFQQLAVPEARHYFEIAPARSGRFAAITGLDPASRGAMSIEALEGTCDGKRLTRAEPDSDLNTAAIFDVQAGQTYCVVTSRSNSVGTHYSLTLAPLP